MGDNVDILLTYPFQVADDAVHMDVHQRRIKGELTGLHQGPPFRVAPILSR